MRVKIILIEIFGAELFVDSIFKVDLTLNPDLNFQESLEDGFCPKNFCFGKLLKWCHV